MSRRYSNTRQMVDFSKVQSLVDCTFVILPTSIWRIKEKLFQERGSWISTYYTERGPYSYDVPNEQDFEAWLDEGRNAIMACDLDGLLSRLDAINLSLQAGNQISQSCCTVAGGAYVSDGEGGVFYGTEPPLDPPTTFGGPGEFADSEAYLLQRCLATNLMVSGLIATLNNMSILSVVSLVAGTAIVGAFVASPPVGVVLALLVAEFASSSFGNFAGYIDDNREDFVCALFVNDTYAGVIDALSDLVHNFCNTFGLLAFEALLVDVVKWMITTDTFNTMYELAALPPANNPVDCNTCIPPAGCGLDGTLQYFPTFCNSGDGEVNVTGATQIEIIGDTDTGGYGYRFSVCWETTWPITDSAARHLTSVVIPAGFDGTSTNGYVLFYRADGVALYPGPKGKADEAAINADLSANPYCIALISCNYGAVPFNMVCNFEEL